eukprot:Gb_32086 [translate_table: standard]
MMNSTCRTVPCSELPPSVEAILAEISSKQCIEPAKEEARQKLACLGEEAALRLLRKLSRRSVRNLTGYILFMVKNETTTFPSSPCTRSPVRTFECRAPVVGIGSTRTCDNDSATSLSVCRESFSYSSPSPSTVRTAESDCSSVISELDESFSKVSLDEVSDAGATAALSDDDLYNSTGKRSETYPDADSEDSISIANFTHENFEWPVITEHLEALGKLDFPKVFLVLSYVAQYRVEDVLSIDDIHELQGLPMANVESKLRQAVAMKSKSPFHFDRKGCGWDPNKTHSYHCYVDREGNCTFKGPFLENTKTHLQRVLGDEHVLQVHFAEELNIEGKSQPSSEEQQRYHRLAIGGILVGLRRYQFFVFKDGGKEAKRQDSRSSSIKCYFVCTDSCAEFDRNSPYILFNKPIHEARRLFMHVHTVASLRKYMTRFSLILSKTIKFEGDISDVEVKRVKDIPCLDENGNEVHVNGEPLIHTDGTGFISEDLALQCPKNTYKGKLLKNEHSERTWDCLEMDNGYQVMEECIGTVTDNQAYPLLLQCRLFHNGSAIKGTFLVNKQLPSKTIYVRESMIKVEEDKSLIGCKTINSLEICGSSRKPNRACLSRCLIALLNYGGVPREFFIDLVTKSLEDIQTIMRDPQKAMKVLKKHQVLDEDDVALRMVSCGIPLDEPYLQHRFKVFMGEEIKKLKEGKVYIDDTFYLMGTADPTGKLKPNQVCVILDHGQVSGKVLVYKNPGLHFGDIHVFKATYIEEIEKIVGTSKFAIFFSTQGPRSAADEIANSDFDGDLYWISMNVKLLEHFQPGIPWTRPAQDNRVCQQRPKDFSSEELEKHLFDDFLNLRFSPSYTVSIAAKSWLVFMDRLLTLQALGTQHAEECEMLKEKMNILTNIYYEALDAPKTGSQVEVKGDLKPEKKPHFMNENTNDTDPIHFYSSSSILGDIYNLATSSYDMLQSQDIWTIPCFEDGNVGEDKILWVKNYEKYRHEMSEALKICDSSKNSRARSVTQSYKKILYGADSLEDSTKPRNQIYKEAISIYQVTYEYARQRQEVARCSFAWNVAGEALCEIYACSQHQRSISCLPSILWKILP